MDEERGWDLEAITAKWQSRWWAAGVQNAERRDDGKPTYFLHFAYPGISGYLHVGHMRGFTYSDVFARYKRMKGFNVLFPAGFHASGIPAVAFAADVKRGEKNDYLLSNGYDPAVDGPITRLEDARNVVDYFAKVYTNDYWKKFGFLIDERRNCTTIDAGYGKFIQWQFRALKKLGYLVQKPHYAPFCPVAGPVAVDKSETDIKQGGSAEVMEFVALRFELDAKHVRGAPADAKHVILPCATLRPETVYGCTNIWIHAEADYHLVRVWKDGAVKDTDPSELWLVSDQGARKLEWQFERAELLGKGSAAHALKGHDLVGKTVVAPVTGKTVPIVAGRFVDPMVASGIVMSVPGHAPFDYAAYIDANLPATLGPPPQIVTVEGYPGLPAKLACEKFRVQSQSDRAALTAATDELYADEFNKGILNDLCGAYAGKRIKAVKDQVKADFLAQGHGRILRQFSEPVVSRAGQVVDIKRIPDQDFIHYADKAWTEKAKAHVTGMNPASSTALVNPANGQTGMAVFPQKYRDELPNVLDWFGDRACVRRGAWLGTEFPFKPGWIVEPIADSTFYAWFYLVQRYLKSEWNPNPPHGGLATEDLTDAFFDYVFNGKGADAKGSPPPTAAGKARLWKEIRDDVHYWGPVDINLGGKEHQTVHFPVYIMNNVALLDDPKLWPKGIFVNWWVTQKAGAKISKSKGGAEPIPGAAKRYGVDAMRLYYCHVGSPHVDIEWDPDIVLDYRKHVERVVRAAEDALAANGEPAPIDEWLQAAFTQAIRTAGSAYEAYDLRGAAGALVYTVPDVLRWYARRGGANGTLLRSLVAEWARALCPMIPHVAEEMFEKAQGDGLCTLATFPEPAPGTAAAIDAEEYVRSVLADIQVVQRLASLEKPTSLTLYTTPAWKRQLAARAVELAASAGGKFPMGAYMQEVMADAAMRSKGKEVQNFTGKMPAQVPQWTASQKGLLASGRDEAEILRAAAPFLAAELGLPKVDVHAADAPDAPDHSKKAMAGPLKPGIALA